MDAYPETMTTLMSVQCPCGQVFQTLPSIGKTDEDGNLRCENCLVEMGLQEDLESEPPDQGPKPEPEGADAETPEEFGNPEDPPSDDNEPVDTEPAEAPEEPVAAVEVDGEVFVPKVDLRTKEGRALKAAGLA